MEWAVHHATRGPRTRGHCGALTDAGQWFQVQWPESQAGINIAAKEMVPVVISVAIWGQEWASHQIRVNMAVVHALTAGMARDPLLMHLLRCLHFFPQA